MDRITYDLKSISFCRTSAILKTDIRNRNSWDTWNLIIEHNLSAHSFFDSIKTELLGCSELLTI
jgi:hypothetical protein